MSALVLALMAGTAAWFAVAIPAAVIVGQRLRSTTSPAPAQPLRPTGWGPLELRGEHLRQQEIARLVAEAAAAETAPMRVA